MTISDFLLILAALFVMALFVGGQTARELADGAYSRRRIAIIAAAWIAFSIASFKTTCGPIGCIYSVKIGWISAIMAGFVGPYWQTAAVTAEMTCYAALTFYIIGHAFGWIRFGLARAWRRAFS